MQANLSFLSLLTLMGCFIGIFLLFNLIPLIRKHRQNIWIATNILAAIILLLEYFFILSGAYCQFPYLLGLGLPLIFTFGPSLYLYSRALLLNYKIKQYDYLHYLPFILFLLMRTPLFMLSKNSKIQLIENSLHEEFSPSWSVLIIYLFIGIHLSGYLVRTYYLLNSVYYLYLEKSSNVLILKIKWLRVVIIVFIFFLGGGLLSLWLWALDSNYAVPAEGLYMLSLCIFIFYLGYYMMNRREVFLFQEPISLKSNNTFSLDATTRKKHLRKLLAYMESEKPFLNPELKLRDLSRDLDIPAHQLSWVINQELGKNFFDFINNYRVLEVKKKLSNDAFSHYTILGIGLDSGFSNKGSFNRIFKKHTGMTPSDFTKNT